MSRFYRVMITERAELELNCECDICSVPLFAEDIAYKDDANTLCCSRQCVADLIAMESAAHRFSARQIGGLS